MSVVLVTGAAGLIGAEAVRVFSSHGLDVVGIDNDMRQHYFGPDGSTRATRKQLLLEVPGYEHHDLDIRDKAGVDTLLARYGRNLTAIIHAAAQPAHDWAATEPLTDFSVNALATLQLLESTRQHAPEATFVLVSTNKVYGDRPNTLPLEERDTRWELPSSHPQFGHGIDETMSVDQTMHSLFGVSKLAADAMTQEFGRYFGMNTACFRCGCVTGANHAGTVQHGFLSYLARCSVRDEPYRIIGYHGKQVRDILHARDLVRMFWCYHQDPRPGEVYNVGGGRDSNCSVLEAIELCETVTGRPMGTSYTDMARRGDHVWYVSDTRKFRGHFPTWAPQFDLTRIVSELVDAHSLSM